jgi:protein involved in polysaccharide export with SLBB domain
MNMTRTLHRNWIRLVVLVGAATTTGCAALTNPVADGVPVNRLPAEVLGRPRSDLKPIPTTLLRRSELKEYRLDKGDVLAVVASEVFGDDRSQVPTKLADAYSNYSSLGYPVPVQDDGTISLPIAKVKPIPVKGLTVQEVQELIRKIITGEFKGKNMGYDIELVKPEFAKVSVQLMQPRKYKVMVIREDASQTPFYNTGGALLGAKKKNGFTVFLEHGRNDVLNALNLTGGPPGDDALDTIIIQRGQFDPADPTKGIMHIPLKKYDDQPLTWSESDIVLKDGDIVSIIGRDTEVYYTGGVIGSHQWPLPRDYDLDILQALAISGAPIVNGGFTQNQFVAQAFASGLGTPSPSLATVLRLLPNGQQVNIRVDLDKALRDPRERIRILPRDTIILQELPGSAVVRYLTQTIRVQTVINSIQSPSVNQATSAITP